MKTVVVLPLACILALGPWSGYRDRRSFAGNTPSMLSVTPGQRTITVKKKDYADWTRTMNVSGTAVHLTADLSAAQ